MEPPEMAVFSFIDLPDVLTHEKKENKFSGILDHSDYDTRESAKGWFQRTSDLSGGTINIDDYYYVLKVEEYEFLKELDVLDLISDRDIN